MRVTGYIRFKGRSVKVLFGFSGGSLDVLTLYYRACPLVFTEYAVPEVDVTHYILW